MNNTNNEVRSGAKIKVIGVGGGGNNMVSRMVKDWKQDIEFIVANTDAQVLSTSSATLKIQLGEKLTKGLGAGMNPEIGKEAALESYDEIKSALDGADIVFISAGEGGGTGTGASPIVAKAAKEVGALAVGVVTKPFKFEGGKRAKLAEKGIADMKEECDSIVIIPNEKLLSIVDKKLSFKDAFRIVDNILIRAVGGMSAVILGHGEDDINLDFADVKTVMSHKGTALMGTGMATGEESAVEAMRKALNSPLLDDVSIHGAMGVLVHFNMHPDCSLFEISEAMNMVEEHVDEEAHVIFGTTSNENLEEGQVIVTIVATGFEKELQKEPKREKEEEKIIRRTPKINKKIADNLDNEDFLKSIDIPTFLRKQMK